MGIASASVGETGRGTPDGAGRGRLNEDCCVLISVLLTKEALASMTITIAWLYYSHIETVSVLVAAILRYTKTA